MQKRAWALIAFMLVPAPVLLGACGKPFSVPGTGGSSGGSGGVPTTSDDGGTAGSGGEMTTSSTSSGSCHDEDKDGVTDCDGDCDDHDAAIYPGAEEICGDAKDNDCNAGADDTCKGLGTFVSSTGSDSNPGTQAQPLLTIKKGIQQAKAIGHGVSVYVAAGSYPEDVVVAEGISLYGAHDPVTWKRDLKNNDTAILPPGAAGLYIDDKVTRKTEIDGFRIQGKDNQTTGDGYGAAVTIDGGSPTLRNNKINGPAQGPGARSIGLALYGPSNDAKGALIEDNTIAGGSGTLAAPCEVSVGVLLDSESWPPPAPGPAIELRGNAIRSGLCASSRAFVSRANAEGSLVQDNDIDAGTATGGDAWGMVVGGSPLDAVMIIDKNRINLSQNVLGGCPLTVGTSSPWCGGIDAQASRAVITNNVVLGLKGVRSAAVRLQSPEVAPESVVLNSNFLDGAGAEVSGGSQSAALVLALSAGTKVTVGRIRNNILFGGGGQARFGVYEDGQAGKTCKPDKLTNNDIFFNDPVASDTLYRAWDGVSATKVTSIANVNMLPNAGSNMNVDPVVDASYHLGATSPCIDKGTAEDAPPDDFDGQPRPEGMNDVGPDER